MDGRRTTSNSNYPRDNSYSGSAEELAQLKTKYAELESAQLENMAQLQSAHAKEMADLKRRQAKTVENLEHQIRTYSLGHFRKIM
jgi:hypothetical protein